MVWRTHRTLANLLFIASLLLLAALVALTLESLDSEIAAHPGAPHDPLQGAGGGAPAGAPAVGLDEPGGVSRDESGGVVRSLTLPSVHVVDAVTRRGIPGAEVRLFDDDDTVLGRVTSNAEGVAVLPADLPLAGLSAYAAGYRYGAVEAGTQALALEAIDTVAVEVRGAGARLLDDYELLASLEFDGKGYPLEWARLDLRSAGRKLITVRAGRCVLERPLAGLSRVVLFGRHRGTGRRQEFDSAIVAADEDTVVFDASRYGQPTGSWLRLTVELPRHDRPYIAYVQIEYRNGDRWLPWPYRRVVRVTPGSERMSGDFVELWPGSYRVSCRFSNSLRGEHFSAPFAVRGATTRTVRVAPRGATVEVRLRGSLASRLTAEDLQLWSGSRGVGTLRRDVSPGVVQFAGVPPGTYWLRTPNWMSNACFPWQEVVVRGTETVFVTATPRPAGRLLVVTSAPGTEVHVFDAVGQRVPGHYLLGFPDGLQAHLPRGRYGVRVRAGPVETVVVGEGLTRFTPGR